MEENRNIRDKIRGAFHGYGNNIRQRVDSFKAMDGTDKRRYITDLLLNQFDSMVNRVVADLDEISCHNVWLDLDQLAKERYACPASLHIIFQRINSNACFIHGQCLPHRLSDIPKIFINTVCADGVGLHAVPPQ